MIYICTAPSIGDTNDMFYHFFYDSEEDKYYSTPRVYKPIYPLQLMNINVRIYNDFVIKNTDLYIDEPFIIESISHDILQNIKDKIIYDSI